MISSGDLALRRVRRTHRTSRGRRASRVCFREETWGIYPRFAGRWTNFGKLWTASTVSFLGDGDTLAWLGAGTTMRAVLLIDASTPAIIAICQDAYVVGTMLALFGFHALTWNVVTISLRQELVPDGCSWDA